MNTHNKMRFIYNISKTNTRYMKQSDLNFYFNYHISIN